MGQDAGLIRFPALRRRLLAWYARSHRDLPWRRTRDPYRIWVSEIMLQQTRAQAVIPYYEKFLQRFPTALALAEASEADVLACWSGLGYYSRARNLRLAARQITSSGAFPRDYDSIRALPGVGDYTAAAVASIAFDLPHAVLDGNVMRVIARLTNDAGDISSPRTRARLREFARSWLDAKSPGRFNQAVMELGATVCLPKSPHCLLCPLSTACEAHARGTVAELPVKLRRTEPVAIAQTLVLVERRNRILLWRRQPESGPMAGFWELPSPEHLPGLAPGPTLGVFRHTITHHHYTFTVVTGAPRRIPRALCWIPHDRLSALPLSTTARKALRLRHVP